MDSKMTEKLALFSENTQSIKKGFRWHDSTTRRLAALLYALESKTIDSEEIQRCHIMLKKNTGVFSGFRGDMSLCIATLLSLSEHPKRLLENTIDVYGKLTDVKFRKSEYLAIAAYLIASGTDNAGYPLAVERTKAFYDELKSFKWVYAGRDDYIFMAMLGLSDIDITSFKGRIEALYKMLKREFRDKSSVLSLTQVLVFCNASDEAVERMVSLSDAMKTQKLRYDKSFTLPALGVLALLPVDVDTTVQLLAEASGFLMNQAGLRRGSVSAQERLLYVAAITASEYSCRENASILTAALSTSITNIIVAQQITVMLTMIAASQAATVAMSAQS